MLCNLMSNNYLYCDIHKKKCPFCGSFENEMVTIYSKHFIEKKCVECKVCKAHGPSLNHDGSVDTYILVHKLWIQREKYYFF